MRRPDLETRQISKLSSLGRYSPVYEFRKVNGARAGAPEALRKNANGLVAKAALDTSLRIISLSRAGDVGTERGCHELSLKKRVVVKETKEK
jgi:hypothetical protein